MAQHFDFIVIGSGPAGRRAAVRAAKLKKSVLVVERGRRVGGVCVHTGTIPSKTAPAHQRRMATGALFNLRRSSASCRSRRSSKARVSR
jgi:pyruvate/2-oxoglutarate dehydrogenase complex dihydrolipoamide dehydrogenase (E3) component